MAHAEKFAALISKHSSIMADVWMYSIIVVAVIYTRQQNSHFDVQ